MPNLTRQEKGVITRFKNKAREFWNVWQSLDSKQGAEAVNLPEFKAEYEALMDRGLSIKGTVENVTAIIDRVANAYDGVKVWINDTFGLDGIQRNSMGALPILIPVAAIAISLAAMGKWVTDAYQLNKRLDAVQRLIDNGTAPGLAVQMINATMPKGFFGGLNKTPPLVIGGGL